MTISIEFPAHWLAQGVRQSSTEGLSSMVGWLAALILAVVVGLWVVLRIKRGLKREDEPTSASGFTLSDLRELHRKGQMTDEEFEAAKARVVASAQRAVDRAAARQDAKAQSGRFAVEQKSAFNGSNREPPAREE